MSAPTLNRLSRARGGFLLAAVACAAAVAGCGRPVGAVSGTVSYHGKALKGGTVTFISTEGQPGAASPINADGKYTVSPVVAGSYKVLVETDSLRPPPGTLPAGGGPKGVVVKPLDPGTNVPEGYKPSSPADAGLSKAAKLYVPIPATYSKAETTDLTVTVTGGDQTFDITLK